jgi:hypothetical protein
MYFKLLGSENIPKIVDKALLHESHEGTFWTKETGWSCISIEGSSHYKLEIDSANIPNHTLDYSVGIQVQELVLTLLRGNYFNFDKE